MLPFQARLKVLKHRDDHVASVMDDAKASLITITRDKAKYTGILQQLLTQGEVLLFIERGAFLRHWTTLLPSALEEDSSKDTFTQDFVSCLSQHFSYVVVKQIKLWLSRFLPCFNHI